MAHGFIDKVKYDALIENIDEVVLGTDQSRPLPMRSNEFTLKAHTDVRLEIRICSSGDNIQFRLEVLDFGELNDLFGHSTLILNGCNGLLENEQQVRVICIERGKLHNKCVLANINANLLVEQPGDLEIQCFLQFQKYDRQSLTLDNIHGLRSKNGFRSKVFFPENFPNLQGFFRIETSDADKFYSRFFCSATTNAQTALPFYIYCRIGKDYKNYKFINKFQPFFNFSNALKITDQDFPLELDFRVAFPAENQNEVDAESLLNEEMQENLSMEQKVDYDCTVIVGDKKIQARKCALIEVSRFFYEQFFIEHKSVVEIKNVDFEIVQECINYYCYNKKLTVPIASDEQWFHAASELKIEALKSHFEQQLCKTTDQSNVEARMKLVDKYNGCDLKRKCLLVALKSSELLNNEVVDQMFEIAMESNLNTTPNSLERI